MENIYVTKAFLPPYEEYIEMIKPLWESCRISNMGDLHKRLETELASYLEVPMVSLFTNGHTALELLIQAMDLKGEVITTPYTFASTSHAIVRNGLKPVFCDIKEDDYTIDEEKIEALITENTSAILPVHVYGHICNHKALEKISRKHNLKLIYDAAHAFGVKIDGESAVGLGDASMISFHATKVFNTVEGGAVVYSEEELGKKLYGLKNFGIRSETLIDAVGSNSKMDEFRAAMGLCNLKYVTASIAERKKVYDRYLENLSEVKGIRLYYVPDNLDYNYSYFPVFFDKEFYGENVRDYIYEELKKNQIFSRKYFYPLITDMGCYCRDYDSSLTPVASKISEGILTLPLYSDLSLEKVDLISNYVKHYLEEFMKG